MAFDAVLYHYNGKLNLTLNEILILRFVVLQLSSKQGYRVGDSRVV